MKAGLRVTGLTILIFLTGLFTSCTDPVDYDDTTTNGTEPSNTYGRIRFIHSASSTSEIDLAYRDLGDNNFYPYQYNAVYGRQYGYSTFISGEREFRIYIPNTNFFISDCIFEVEENKSYTLIAHDYEAALDTSIMVVQDSLIDAGKGFAQLRIIHLSSDLPAITINETDSSGTIVELDHLEYSNYLNLPAKTYRFVVRSSGELIKALEPFTLQSGQIYTGILSGSVADLTARELNMIVYTDASIK